MNVKSLISLLSQQLKSAGNPQKQKDLSKYLKGVLPCYGLSHPQGRALFKEFYAAHLTEYSQDAIRTLGFELLKMNGFDEKFQGIECLVKTMKTFTPQHLRALEPIIDECVFDWATSDNLSCHVITKAMISSPECIHIVNSWKDAPSWRQRSACVSMLHFARRDLHTDVILDICERAVLNKYRFTQLGVGWVLRDVSVHHPQLIIDFLNKHEEDFIKEAVRYATEKMAPSQKKQVHSLQRKCDCLQQTRQLGYTSIASRNCLVLELQTLRNAVATPLLPSLHRHNSLPRLDAPSQASELIVPSHHFLHRSREHRVHFAHPSPITDQNRVCENASEDICRNA